MAAHSRDSNTMMKIFCGLVLAATATAQKPDNPKKLVAALDTNFSALYNAGKIAEVAALYNVDARLMPPDANGLFDRADLFKFFNESWHAGLRNLSLVPVEVVADGPPNFALHEIGNATHSMNPGGGLYYVRWIKPHGTWEVALDLMAVGGKWSATPEPIDPEKENPVTDMVAQLDDVWNAIYDKQDWPSLAPLYGEDALLLAPGAGQFENSPALDGAAYFRDTREAGYVNVSRTPAKTLQQTKTLVHEIGNLVYATDKGYTGGAPSPLTSASFRRWRTATPRSPRRRFYSRFECLGPKKPCAWKRTLDVLSLGEPPAPAV